MTIVFSDLAGSTQLGERLEPETLRAIMTRYFAAMRAAVEYHGGTVEKFIGDAVMAVWGVPARREDDAIRAVRAAAEMNAAQDELNDELESRYGLRLAVRTGVNTGEVVAGDPTQGQAFVNGDAVNVAARLEQAAAPGEVLLGGETQGLVRDVALTEPVAPLSLKGKAERLPAFRLLGLRKAPQRGDSTPLVGRERELAALEAEFAAVEREGTWRRVAVVGPAGVGKTRLMEELANKLSGRARVVAARCPSYGAGTWWPVAEIARTAAGIELSDAPSAARSKLATLLEDEDPATATILSGLFGISEGVVSAEDAGWAVPRLFDRLADDGPLLVVLDDVQWAGSALQNLLERIEPGDGRAPVLFVCLARPELGQVRSALVAAPVIRLDSLSQADAHRLAEALLGVALPAPVATEVLRAAGGNPLFVQELLRMLRDEDVLALVDGEWQLRAGAGFRVPPTIEALLAARLDQVGTGSRTVAERAALIGQEFAREEVEELLDSSAEADLDRHLATLLRHELLRPGAGIAGALRFSHLLIRDVAYQGMLKELRAALHERFAGWLEQRLGERLAEYDEIVGHHLEQAHRYRVELAPPGPAEQTLGRRAAVRLLSAGRRAATRHDYSAAVSLLRRASDIGAFDEPVRIDALLDLAWVLRSSGEFGQALALADEVATVAERTGRRAVLARADIARCDAWTFADPDRAQDGRSRVAAAALELKAEGDHRGAAEAFLLHGELMSATLELNRGRELRGEARRLARAAGHVRVIEDSQMYDLMYLSNDDTPVRVALREVDAVLDDSTASASLVLVARSEQAELLAMAGETSAARTLAHSVIATMDDRGLTLLRALYMQGVGFIERLAHDPRAAESALRSGIDTLGELSEESARWTHATMLAFALLAQGRDLEAEVLSDEVMSRAPDVDVVSQTDWRRVRATILSRRGTHEEAIKLARAAVALAPHATPVLAGDAQRTLALVLAAAGRRTDAIAAQRDALAAYERKGVAPLLAATRAGLGRLTSSVA